MKSSPRPRPRSSSAPTTSPRPPARDNEYMSAVGAVRRGNRASKAEATDYEAGKKTKKMAKGGKIRGCGAATKGTSYSRGG